MRLERPLGGLLLAAVLVAAPVAARTIDVPARPHVATALLRGASPGDTLRLASGVHRGPLVLDRPVLLRGAPGAVLEGGGRGTVLIVTASGATVESLQVRGSGRRVLTVDSGVRVSVAADVTLRDLRLADVLYGIYAERAAGLRIERCFLRGRVRPLDETGEGNGIHLWYTDAATIRGSDVQGFADAIYLSFANDIRVLGSRLHDNGRYGLHTMYCQRNRLEENVFTRNVAGCAIMFSNHLEVARNLFVRNRGPRTYGLLLRDCSDGRFVRNRLAQNTVAIFLDNSNRNRFEENLVQDNGWGIILFSSSTSNVFTRNAFLNDDYPVALDMRRTNNAFDDGRRGNFWSDHVAYDLDGDGVGDAPHGPVSAFAFVSKQFPDLALLAKSPAVAALAVGERVFPALRPSEAVDRFPLTAPPPVGRVAPGEAEPEAAWPAFGAFAAIGAAGAAGLFLGRRT